MARWALGGAGSSGKQSPCCRTLDWLIGLLLQDWIWPPLAVWMSASQSHGTALQLHQT